MTMTEKSQEKNIDDTVVKATDPGRREILKVAGLTAGSTLVGMAPSSLEAAAFEREAIDGPPAHNPSSEYVFSITAEISGALTVGETTTGQVRAIPITGGSVDGENFSGIVVPGGADWQQTRKDNVTEIEAIYMIQLQGESGEQTFVKVVNRGLIVPPEQPGGAAYFRTRIMFTAPQGEFAWMNEAIFLSRVGLHPDVDSAVLVEVFRLV